MNLTQLLLKGDASTIAKSPLAPGIGPKGAANIVNARSDTSDILDLVLAGTNRTETQNTLLNTLVREEPSARQAGRSSVADVLRQRSQNKELRVHPSGTPVALFGEKSGAPSGAYTPTPMRLLEYDPTVQTTRVQGGAIPLGGPADAGDVVKDIRGNTFIDKGFDQRRLAEQELNRIDEGMIDEGMMSNYDEFMGLPQVRPGQKLKKGQFGDTSDMKKYDDAAQMRSNTTTATESMSGGTTGNFVGRYQPGETPSSSELLGSMSQDGAVGVMSSMAFGAAIGGAANYAMGGEFGEGAMMGGIAGGGIKIGARAIQQNQASIESFLQRTALGDTGQNMTRDQAVTAIQGLTAAPEGAGLMQKGAFNMLKSESPSLGMQSRYMVMGGSALAGVTFTGNRKDKRRGFNAHRGNRI